MREFAATGSKIEDNVLRPEDRCDLDVKCYFLIVMSKARDVNLRVGTSLQFVPRRFLGIIENGLSAGAGGNRGLTPPRPIIRSYH